MGHNGTNNTELGFGWSPNPITEIIIMILCILLAAILFSCKSSGTNVITAKETDTLHVYHTDTVMECRIDSIRVITEVLVRDSIATTVKEVYFVNSETGDTIRSEREVSKDSWHSNNTMALFTRTTADSVIQAKADSIVRASHREKPIVVEVEKSAPWYKKALNAINTHIAGIMIAAMLAFLIYLLGVKKNK